MLIIYLLPGEGDPGLYTYQASAGATPATLTDRTEPTINFCRPRGAWRLAPASLAHTFLTTTTPPARPASCELPSRLPFLRSSAAAGGSRFGESSSADPVALKRGSLVCVHQRRSFASASLVDAQSTVVRASKRC